MINKILCFMWGHAWARDIEYYFYSFPNQISKDKWVFKERISTCTVTKCKHCGARK